MPTSPLEMHTSSINRILGRPRPIWANAGISACLLLAPMLSLYLDGLLGEVLSRGSWRPLMLPAVVLVYILAIGPILARSDAAVLKAFRPLVLLDDEEFALLVKRALRTNPFAEAAALGLGAALGFWMGAQSVSDVETFWLSAYMRVFMGLMFGLLGWTIYGSMVTTRLTAELHSQPLQFDIFDVRPFEPIGRQSLNLALAYFGGITLSMLFGLNTENIYAWETWLVYTPLVMVSVLVFFMNMRHTHRVLAAEKKRQLQAVEREIQAAIVTIRRSLAENQSIAAMAPEFNALVAYEARLRTTRTWPYNTAMLRTLFFTILFPLLVRGLSTLLFEN